MRVSSNLVLVASLLALGAQAGDGQAANELCGQTITQDLTLTADQTCTGDGLVLSGEKLTIDLGGFTLTGDRGNGDDGIDVTGVKNVVIKNGTIRNFDNGVANQAFGPRVVKLSRVALRDNVKSGLYVLVDQCVVVDKGSASGNTIGLTMGGPSAKVAGTVVAGNAVDGIQATVDTLVVTKAVVAGNGGQGLHVGGGGAHVTIKSSQVVRNGTAGIFLAENPGGPGAMVVAKNRVVGNGGFGIIVSGDGDPTHVVPATISGNVIAGNRVGGVGIGSDSDDTVVSGNRILGNGGAGVAIETPADRALVKGNTIAGNSGAGIMTTNGNAQLAKNALVGNVFAIMAPAGAVDGGGNTSRANVEPSCSASIACAPRFQPKSGPVDPTCGMHVTSSITLGDDTPPCDGDGLLVDADDVTIDLNGHIVGGNFNSGTIGIRFADVVQRVKVANGTVRGFATGIGGGETFGLVLSNVEVRDNVEGASLSGRDIVVDKSDFVNHVGDGLDVGQVQGATTIKSSAFVGNGSDGIEASEVTVAATKITAAGNQGFGINLVVEGDAQVTKSLLAANGAAGVGIAGTFGQASPVTIKKNEIFGNGGDGIRAATTPLGAVLEGNVSGGNGGRGIAVMNNPGGTRVTKNDLVGNSTDGLFVDVTVGSTTVGQNRALGNGASGLNVGIAAATLAKNAATGNQLIGINTPFGAVDGGGNTARDNVTDPQCTAPIVCP